MPPPSARRPALVFCLTIVSFCLPGTAQARPVVIDAASLRCIAENLNAYLAAPDDPVFVIPRLCPRIPTVDDLADAATASTAGSGVVIPRNESSQLRILRKFELRCLAAVYRNLRRQGRLPTTIRLDTRRCPGA